MTVTKRVEFVSENSTKYDPAKGTKGTVVSETPDATLVNWDEHSLDDKEWWAPNSDISIIDSDFDEDDAPFAAGNISSEFA